MRKYLLPEGGNFYKANLHCHTDISDGKMTPQEVKEEYKKRGYSVIAFTDHDVLVPHPELADELFLPLNGYEIEITEVGDKPFRFKKTCHMCLIATDPDNVKQVCFHRTKYFVGNGREYANVIRFDENAPDYERDYNKDCVNEVMAAGRKNGFFVTYNHPAWSLENYNDYMGYEHMHAMEIYNNESVLLGCGDYNEKEYDDMLRGGKRIYCIAADDNHSIKSCCGGFTMIKADKLEYKTITSALLNGSFYASYGPLIEKLWFEDGKIHIECSEAECVTLNTFSRRTQVIRKEAEGFVTSAELEVLPDDGFVRITVTDSMGRHANTNAYFTDELFD